MKLTFDYYQNLERVDLFLCNPDGRGLFPLPGRERVVTLRFNDLSELTFEVDSQTTLSNGDVIDLEAYDYIRTKRLVYATNIGWFQISGVDEHDNGIVKYKSVTAESLQAVFKNKGFISEDRVYCFYNPNDPYDDRYDHSKDDSIPSVLGQWSKQLGIKQALDQGTNDPETPYDDWTVTYINDDLIYSGLGSKCRTFSEKTTYGYDWMVNDVEDAFEVIVLFDFMYKTIHIMTPDEVSQKVNVLSTFSNFMKSVDINEASEDIVTVLNCNGNNCDITSVNPTGTNYICDFSYYMDKVNYRWMSRDLIDKLEQWKAECDVYKETYEGYIEELRSLYESVTENETLLREMSLSLADLRAAQNKRTVLGNGGAGDLCGIVTAESVKSPRVIVDGVTITVNGYSIQEGTRYYDTAFTGEETITAYQFAPEYNPDTSRWEWGRSNPSITDSADSIIASNLSDDNTLGVSYWYFSDVDDGSSYCKLQSSVSVNKGDASSTYYCSGFDRYIAYTYPTVDNDTGITTYTDSVQYWIDLRESRVNEINIFLCGYPIQLNGYQYDKAGEVINPTPQSLYGRIKVLDSQIKEITSLLNILAYFADSPTLLRELNCYWIEGDYTNENIAVLDSTTPEEEIDLSNELLRSGYTELNKVCRPRFSFTIDSIDVTKQYEFKEQMQLLELGKKITIEKEEGVWYEPVLLEISFKLDSSDNFSLTFANAMRLDDWSYTYADLIADASSTSRQVSANWQDILSYTKDRESISSIIQDPLNTTLRASTANMVNQEFLINENGILGRKKVAMDSTEFENEQVRLINNLLIFTDDNWQTAKTALGKIYYTDENGQMASSYGLIAETIIGSLIMGEKLKIHNQQSTIVLGSEGITIKQSDGTVVFSAGVDGTLLVNNYATKDSVASAIELANHGIDAYVTADGGNKSSFGWSLKPEGFYLYSGSTTPIMSVTPSGLVLKGKISATGGDIGGFTIGTNALYTGTMSYFTTSSLTNLTGVYVGKDGIQMRATHSSGTHNGKTGRFWVNAYGQVCIEMGDPGTGAFFSFDFDGFHIHNGLAMTDENFADIGIQPGHIQIYKTSSSGNIMSVIPIRFDAKNDEYYLNGTWYLNDSAIATTSWREAKEAIEELPENYEVMFDYLKPVRFKYVEGKSGRYHTGFILDEMKTAMDIAGLSTAEVGAYCVSDTSTGRGGIRYEELIAICVKKIQKLERELNTLKNTIGG